jgi:hypothetical protein
MPMNSPRERVEHEHAHERGHRCDEVGSSCEPVDAAQDPRMSAIELHERGNVHELDDGRDDDSGQDCLRKLFEQAGQEEQRHYREHGDHER